MQGNVDIAKATRRLLAIEEAKSSLLQFLRLMNPDPDDMEDAGRSLYQETPQARLLCEVMEKIAAGDLSRAAVSMPPQFGKSSVISHAFPAWIAGRFPWIKLILGTYSQEFAEEWGGKVRALMTSDPYRQIFPGLSFRKGGSSRGLLVIDDHGGELAFVGRDGKTTGKAGDMLIIDDALKNKAEADSPTILRQIWEWFTAVTFSRCHSSSAIVVVHTRWNQNDLIGRLCDPEHPEHDKLTAEKWKYINIPAVVTDQKLADALGLKLEMPADDEVKLQFGDRPMSSLWPERKGLKFLAEAKRLDKSVFEALYQGNPSPEDGDYFKRANLIGYKLEDLPRNLRKYSASDHAVSPKEEERRDKTCMGTVGVDEDGILWVLPDLYWEREGDTSKIVEMMINKMQLHEPMIWWAENEHISKSFKPFLVKRMIEERCYGTMLDDSITPSKELLVRARSIRGMIELGRVRFPTFAPWWPEAQAEMLRFPNAVHDDFVSFMSLIGTGLLREIKPSKTREPEKVVRVGSLAWVKARSEAEKRRAKRLTAAGGM